MNLTPKNNPVEFNEFLFKKVGLNLFKHKFLGEYIRGVQQGSKILYDASLLNTSENGWILILHGEILLIYGENWDKTQFQEIQEILELNKFTNYIIQGESKLIYSLIDYFKLEKYSMIKERIFYKTKKIVDFKVGDRKIELGNMSDIIELSRMLQQYYHEEYNGTNDKSLDEMQQRIFSLIQTRSIFVLKNPNGHILSFCTIIDPDIGILFTQTEHRGKGLGKILLSFCSQLLQQKNGEVFIMTDKEKISSDKVCKAVGFKPFFENTLTEINND